MLLDKAFDFAKDPINDGYQRGFASLFYKFSNKKASGSCIKSENISNKELVEEWHKPIIRNVSKRKLYSPFIDNVWVHI